MKKTVLFLSLLSLLVVSCKKSNPTMQGIVTFKTANNTCYLQLSDSVALKPENLSANPFGVQCRGYILFEDKGVLSSAPISGLKSQEWRSAYINAYKKILTKSPVDVAEGDACVEILKSWANGIEDGYMTLNFVGAWGNKAVTHTINLVEGEEPLHYYLQHDNCGDINPYRYVSSLVAFDLHDMPIPNQREYDVYLSYYSFKKEMKTLKFHCKDGVYQAPEKVDSYTFDSVEENFEASSLFE